MDPALRFKRYALRFLAWLALGLGATIALGLAVDPYAFSWPHKYLDPAFRENDLEVRMNIISQIAPDGLLLGNSRAQHGLDPHEPVFGNLVVFNAGVVGGKPGDFLYLLQTAEHNHPLKLLVIGTDFNMVYSGLDPRVANQTLLRHDGPFSFLGRVRATLSIDAVLSEVVELARYFRGSDHMLETSGRLREALYKHDVDVRGGPLAALRHRDAEAMMRMGDPPSPYFLRDLNSILDIACANHTRVVLFFSPIHVRQLESAREVGKWQESIDWKKSELDLVNSKTHCDIELWDFARHSKVSEERAPVSGDMKYYWDGSHFKKIVGDAALTISVGRQTDPSQWSKEFGPDFGPDFGEQLTEANFANSMRREDEAAAAWAAANPDIVAELHALKKTTPVNSAAE